MDPKDESIAETAKTKAISQRKIDANRQNAQKSTGPKTSEGKAKTCLNAEPGSQTTADLDTEPEPNGAAEAQPEAEVEPVAEPEAERDAEPQADPEAKLGRKLAELSKLLLRAKYGRSRN